MAERPEVELADVERTAAAHYAHLMGHDLPLAERRDRARRLSATAPTVRRQAVDDDA